MSFSGSPGELDSDRFEQLCGRGPGTRWRRPTQRARLTLLREGLSRRRRPPLADLTFEAFAQADIARLDEQRLGALETRVDGRSRGGAACCAGRRAAAARGRPPHPRTAGRPAQPLALYRCGLGRPRPSRPSRTLGAGSWRTSAWSRARSCGSCRRRYCARTRSLDLQPSVVELPRELDPAAAPPLAGRTARPRPAARALRAGGGGGSARRRPPSGPRGNGQEPARWPSSPARRIAAPAPWSCTRPGRALPAPHCDVLDRARRSDPPRRCWWSTTRIGPNPRRASPRLGDLSASEPPSAPALPAWPRARAPAWSRRSSRDLGAPPAPPGLGPHSTPRWSGPSPISIRSPCRSADLHACPRPTARAASGRDSRRQFDELASDGGAGEGGATARGGDGRPRCRGTWRSSVRWKRSWPAAWWTSRVARERLTLVGGH